MLFHYRTKFAEVLFFFLKEKREMITSDSQSTQYLEVMSLMGAFSSYKCPEHQGRGYFGGDLPLPGFDHKFPLGS